MKPEEEARQQIDQLLAEAGWRVQDMSGLNLGVGRGVAIREFSLTTGAADYLLFVDRMAAGVIEAKPVGTTLGGVSDKSAKYQVGIPETLPHVQTPLPFAYESSGVETFFRDERDPEPRSRRVFSFHRPETIADGPASRVESLGGREQRAVVRFMQVHARLPHPAPPGPACAAPHDSARGWSPCCNTCLVVLGSRLRTDARSLWTDHRLAWGRTW